MNSNKFSKYELYEASVLDPKSDVKLFRKFYRDTFKRNAFLYREDFCGTFLHSAEWVKADPKNIAYALDLSMEPIRYGMKNHFSRLSSDQKRRLHIKNRDVIRGISQKVDLITATNFSFFCLKERETMKKYFQNSFKTLKSKGLFLIDVMGGSQLQEASIEKSPIAWGKGKPRLTYYWEQKNFDAIRGDAKFSIHFRLGKSRRRLKNVFNYDWRLWTIPELRELMHEVGFDRSDVYWEGSDRDGNGNGTFSRKNREENCEVWIAYIAGVKL